MMRRTLLAGLLAGVIAGLAVTAVQLLRLTPLIDAAEVYERAAEAQPAPGHQHEAEAAAWEAADGWERTGFTLLANIVIACGFGLLLAGGFTWRHAVSDSEIGWARGLLWGLAGFATFSLAPALGLPPSPPGALVADLASRQAWWLLTAIATGAGIGLAVFARTWMLRALSLPLLVLPHIFGAPRPPPSHGAVPPALAADFAVSSLATAAFFWILLGGAGGWLYARLGRASA